MHQFLDASVLARFDEIYTITLNLHYNKLLHSPFIKLIIYTEYQYLDQFVIGPIGNRVLFYNKFIPW